VGYPHAELFDWSRHSSGNKSNRDEKRLQLKTHPLAAPSTKTVKDQLELGALDRARPHSLAESDAP
jgi:hypothetical protein